MPGKTSRDLSWLPPREEWDFRGVTEAEARLACCWEFARSAPEVLADPHTWARSAGAGTIVGWLMQFGCLIGGVTFPQPWLSATLEQRTKSLESVKPIGVRVTPITDIFTRLRELFESMGRPDGSGSISLPAIRARIEALLSETVGSTGPMAVSNWPDPTSYLLQVNFSMLGSDGVVRDLRRWIQNEVKNYPYSRPPTAKAAAPPFDQLKWLATYRLEAARKTAKISVDRVCEDLKTFERQAPVANGNPVLPKYSTHGAWSTAKKKAFRGLQDFARNPVLFERRVFHFEKFP